METATNVLLTITLEKKHLAWSATKNASGVLVGVRARGPGRGDRSLARPISAPPQVPLGRQRRPSAGMNSGRAVAWLRL